jgi:PilZ domain
MTQDYPASIAYQMAARNSAEAAAASARTGRTDANSGSDDAEKSYRGPEKRRTPRYRCEGKAEMYEIGCDARTSATFSDISLHGCYVETQATYPVKTALRITLEANGYKVEATGNVRVNYPYAGMGIALTEMTDESRAQLKALLTSIIRPAMIMGPGIASSLPVRGLKESVPLISDPGAALQALIDFFESKQTLTRDDFLRVLRQSQTARAES